MKLLPVLSLTFSYFFLYLVIVYALGEFFFLDLNVIVILLIGLFFSEIFALLLIFDFPEKLANKLLGKKRIVEDSEEEEEPEEKVQQEIAEPVPEKVEELY